MPTRLIQAWQPRCLSAFQGRHQGNTWVTAYKQVFLFELYYLARRSMQRTPTITVSFWTEDTGTATCGTAEEHDTGVRCRSHLSRAHWLETYTSSSYPTVNPQQSCNTSVWQLCILYHLVAQELKLTGECWKWERIFYKLMDTNADSNMYVTSWSSRRSLGILLTGKHHNLKETHQTS